MLSVVTKAPLQVLHPPKPMIRLPYSQAEEVKRLLEAHGFRPHIQENILSVNNGPYMAYVELEWGADAAKVQAVLDSVP